MSTSNIENPIFCGQCGMKLLPDKTCPNTECIAYGGRSSPSYNLTEPTISSRGLQQSPITPRLPVSGVYTPTLPVYPSQPSPRSTRNTIYLIVVPLLALILISTGILVGMQLVRSNQQGLTSNTPDSSNHSGTTPINGNATATNTIATSTPALTATPTSAPVAPGIVIRTTL